MLNNQIIQGQAEFVGQKEYPSQKNPNFYKRRLVLKVQEQTQNGPITKYIELEATGKAADTLDNVAPGQMIYCNVDLSGTTKLYQDKQTGEPRAYTSVRVFGIERIQNQQQPQQGGQNWQQQAPPPQQQPQQGGQNWQQSPTQGQQQNFQHQNPPQQQSRGGYPDNYTPNNQ